ncbi:MAG: hypothetical protein AB7G17_13220 [Phycisphaerales bacterium]
MAAPLFDMRVKDLFFDRPKVQRAVDRARRRALSKAGAFIRQRARTSMRRRRGSSAPGSPPHAHEGSLRRLLFFAYDPSADSVVVGPVGFRRSDAPNTLEFGGAATVTRRRTRPRSGGTRGVESRRVRIEARPYMGPALRKELPNLPKPWASSVRGG